MVNWEKYKDIKNNYSIKYPAEWEIKTTENNTMFKSPKKGENDPFRENLNILVQDLSSSNINLEEYSKITRKQVVDNLGERAILSLQSTKLNGLPAKEFIYIMSYQGKPLKVTQYWIIHKQMAFLLSFTSAKDEHDEYAPILKEMINSFALN